MAQSLLGTAHRDARNKQFFIHLSKDLFPSTKLYMYRTCVVVPERGGLRGLFHSEQPAESRPTTLRIDCETNERVKAYFKDELLVSKGKIKYRHKNPSKSLYDNTDSDSRHYLYQGDTMVYGFYEGGEWSFGIKDQGLDFHGKEIFCTAKDGPWTCKVRPAEYPL